MESFVLIMLIAFVAVVVVSTAMLGICSPSTRWGSNACAFGSVGIVIVSGLGFLLWTFQSPSDGKLRLNPYLFTVSAICVCLGAIVGLSLVLLLQRARRRARAANEKEIGVGPHY